jgi:hypothetical protein
MLRAIVLVALVGCVVPAEPVYYGGNPPPAPYGYQQGYTTAPQQTTCRLGSDGQQACGYDCKIGSDGIAACANTPGGRCAMGSDGHVYCSQQTNVFQQTAPTKCHLNSDGTQTCGYNCRLGSNGYHYCASTPDGRCALNSNGTWSCS